MWESLQQFHMKIQKEISKPLVILATRRSLKFDMFMRDILLGFPLDIP